jgi:hypothetical protein
MVNDIVEELQSDKVCKCEADLRSIAAHEILRGRSLATAVRTLLIAIEDGDCCMKPVDLTKQAEADAATEFNDCLREMVNGIKQLLGDG